MPELSCSRYLPFVNLTFSQMTLTVSNLAIPEQYADCIAACQECLIDCQACLAAMATKESMNDCPRCCVDCVDACLIAVKFMASDSKYAKQYCSLCADICDWCAAQCAEHDHAHCQKCAESSRKCAEACRAM